MSKALCLAKNFNEVWRQKDKANRQVIFEQFLSTPAVRCEIRPKPLNRCENEDDWVRMEISRALRKGKNVVPVMLCGFEFPDVLPDEIDAIRMQSGVNANSHEYFDAAINRLADKFLKIESQISIPEMSAKLQERIHSQPEKTTAKSRKSKLLTSAVIAVFLVIARAVVFQLNFGGGFGDSGGDAVKVVITIHNNTEYAVNYISLKRSAVADRGENLAGDTPLNPDESVITEIPLAEAGIQHT